MVLLEEAASHELLPCLLKPAGSQRETYDPQRDENPLLSDDLFAQFVQPHLLKIFNVRDAQIRLVLLR